tara:strand:- start:1 stop:504 length:504 start_codon:yes stop_codon:yes gene_type:complete
MATVIRGSDNFDTAFAKSVAIIADVKAYNLEGGTFTSGAWQTRDLNTELDDPSNIVTISSSQFTLQAGTYLIEWSTPAYKIDRHFSRLQNITDSTTDAEGTTEYGITTAMVQSISLGAAVVTVATAKVFEIQHQCTATKAVNGFGISSNTSGVNSVYTLVKIHKIGA